MTKVEYEALVSYFENRRNMNAANAFHFHNEIDAQRADAASVEDRMVLKALKEGKIPGVEVES